jgi:hypothetical protein
LDPTGLIWMGARYYDPVIGQFLSQDPVSYPISMNLYTYANGDPINYCDPDGRFFSPVYSAWTNPHVQGGLQAFGGLVEATVGAGMTYSTGGAAAPVGWAVMAHGLDHVSAGLQTAWSGRYNETATSQLLQKTGMSAQSANFTDGCLSMAGTMGGTIAINASRTVELSTLSLQANYAIECNQTTEQILFGQQTVSAFFSKVGKFKARSISEILQELRTGIISSEALPIEIIVRNGQRVTLNNRSLLALKRAKLEPKIIIDRTGLPIYEELLDFHLRGSCPSNFIKVRGGPPGTSLINP